MTDAKQRALIDKNYTLWCEYDAAMRDEQFGKAFKLSLKLYKNYLVLRFKYGMKNDGKR